MQKIIIKNFGPVKDAEIEIKNILVLIGEQASGKSTIAKLIYFFKSIGDDFFNEFYNGFENFENFRENFIVTINSKFINFFRSNINFQKVKNEHLNIKFFYSENKFIEIKLVNNDSIETKILVNFSDNLITSTLVDKLKKNKEINDKFNNRFKLDPVRQILGLDKNDFLLAQEVQNSARDSAYLIANEFNLKQNNKLYLVAGRETTVSNEEVFNAYFEKLQKNKFIENNNLNIRSSDENLMFEFLFATKRIKSIFLNYGGSFVKLISSLKNGNDIDSAFLKNIEKILKADYEIRNDSERLNLENGQSIFLSDASSGQKEVIRIIQDLVLIILEKQNALRVIEEPEAHLFPVAQKQLVELLVYMKNFNPNNQIIITTHSPYILTVFNNLLFASRVIAKAPQSETEVNAKIPKVFHVDPNDFAAYSLGNSSDIESNYCEEIFSKETGLIDQNYLDTVSEILGDEFDYLYSLYAKNLRATV